ncbi:MAG TPA: 3-isopropylmalate dehydrogenase [Gammaproteobacteria bacterium]|nr:3-isopropylmalate dehydrogenase [Gammaproteobacteria bacterium]
MPGDGIGPEVTRCALQVLNKVIAGSELDLTMVEGAIGGSGYDQYGDPFPEPTRALLPTTRAVLFGAVGGPQWDTLERRFRPEQGLLGIRAAMGVFANLRPAILYPQLAAASALKPEIVSGLDILILRELIGGIYFGSPRGIETLASGERRGVNTLVYTESEIKRIAHMGFRIAQQRKGRLCSVDKANVLECSELWRDVVTQIGKEYPTVELSHLYVDNAAMQLIRDPKQFDVMLTSNLFGDILSDAASMLTGSIGMLPSASLNQDNVGMYEPIHGSAPDIAGQNKANPLAMILSVAMMLRHSFERNDLALQIENAIGTVLDEGLRTPDIAPAGTKAVGTVAMGQAVLDALI